jgi:hypothetical protein
MKSVKSEFVELILSKTQYFFFYCLTSTLLIFVWYINLESYNFYNILAFHNKEKLYEYIATNGFLSVAQENLAEAVEKTLSIFELLTSGGLAGNIIMASLFLMFFYFIYTLSA